MPFWLNICELFSDISVLPSKDMDTDGKLNALTRLVLIISLGLYIMLDSNQWLQFLLLALVVLVVLYFINRQNAGSSTTTENFTITPTYLSDDFTQTVVAPTFAEEWHNPPPAYDVQVEAIPMNEFPQEAPMNPQSYPYGQYLTRTNLLPSDEQTIRMGDGSVLKAREMVNSFWTRNDIAYKENMSRIHKLRQDRRFRHNTQDTFSPFHSF